MEEEEKKGFEIEIYAVNGEHIRCQCDSLRIEKEELRLYRIEDPNNDYVRDWIAAFELKNIVGWKEIG